MALDMIIEIDGSHQTILSGRANLLVGGDGFKTISSLRSDQKEKILSYNVGVEIGQQHTSKIILAGEVQEYKVNQKLATMGRAYLRHFESVFEESYSCILLEPAGCNDVSVLEIIDYFFTRETKQQSTALLIIDWKIFVDNFRFGEFKLFDLANIYQDKIQHQAFKVKQ